MDKENVTPFQRKPMCKCPSSTAAGMKMKDLYTQYDGDPSSSSQNYFFLPVRQDKDVGKFRQDFIKMNRLKSFEQKQSKDHRFVKTSPSATTTSNSNSNSNFNSSRLKYSKNSDYVNASVAERRHIIIEPSNDDDDYCNIRSDSKITHFHSMQSPNKKSTLHEYTPSSTRMKKENMSEFISRLNTYQSIQDSSALAKYSSRDDDVITQLKKQNSLHSNHHHSHPREHDTAVSCCICVNSRNGRNNCTRVSKTDDYFETCSCGEPKKTSFSRYLCMGVLTIFFPCLVCFVGVKVCKRNHSDEPKSIEDDPSHFKKKLLT